MSYLRTAGPGPLMSSPGTVCFNDTTGTNFVKSIREKFETSPRSEPVNQKLPVTRQLSGGSSKNIKRTPAFRAKQFQGLSPSKERSFPGFSIVDKNVRLFEDVDSRVRTPGDQESIRTRILSQQRDISRNCSFFKNGDEYTQVLKSAGTGDPGNPEVSDSLQAALQAPLPAGPPPKKPPRTFAHFNSRPEPEPDPEPELEPELEPAKEKDSKKMLEKLETVLIQHQKGIGPRVIVPKVDRRRLDPLPSVPTSTSPSGGRTKVIKGFDCLPYLKCSSNVYESVRNPDFKSYFPEDLDHREDAELGTTLGPGRSRSEECIYAEPFSFDTKSGVDVTGVWNRKDSRLDVLVERIIDEAFSQGKRNPVESDSDTDSFASSQSLNDEGPTSKEIPRDNGRTFEELHRCLTERRKCYVRRVSSQYSERRDLAVEDRRKKLFDAWLLVELNLGTRKPYIKNKFPTNAKVPTWIENFCFPDATNWPQKNNDHRMYSLTLTDERGNRRYGYCYRVQPERGPILPLVYCLLTKHRSAGFYFRILQQLEARHGLPERQRTRFIETLYNRELPRLGDSLRISVDQCLENIGSSQRPEELDVVIHRSEDRRLENKDMSELFQTVSHQVLILLFSSLLLERKVILMCQKISKLSFCVEALQSLLYPFQWQHTFIPILPDIPELAEILEAPLPFIIGIFKPNVDVDLDLSSVEDGIVVDLDTSKVLTAVGDEVTILPPRFRRGIKTALNLLAGNSKITEGQRNAFVSEAFLRVFVETCSHCDSHFVTQQDGKIIFQKESFVKAVQSRKTQYFLEWFVETTMFNDFVREYILRMSGSSTETDDNLALFRQRVAEHQRKNMEKLTSPNKSGYNKIKSLGDRLKDLTFNT